MFKLKKWLVLQEVTWFCFEFYQQCLDRVNGLVDLGVERKFRPRHYSGEAREEGKLMKPSL